MVAAIFSAMVMLRMAMPAWLATDASSRLSLVEYGSSDNLGPSTAQSLQLALARAANRYQALRLQRLQLRSVHSFGKQFQRIAAVRQFGESWLAPVRKCPCFCWRIARVRLQLSADRLRKVHVHRTGMQRILNLIMQQRGQVLHVAADEVSVFEARFSRICCASYAGMRKKGPVQAAFRTRRSFTWVAPEISRTAKRGAYRDGRLSIPRRNSAARTPARTKMVQPYRNGEYQNHKPALYHENNGHFRFSSTGISSTRCFTTA